MTTRQLRPYQAEAIHKLRLSLASGKRRPVLMAATGAGKTRISAAIFDMARKKGKRAAFVVPALSLIDQTVEAFWSDGIRDVGVIQADHPLTDWSKPVQVCSIQTLERRAYPEVDLVLVDECHRGSKFLERWMSDPAWQNVPFIGLSATPWAKGMGKLFDDLIIAATTEDLIQAGYLSPFRVFAPSHPDLSAVRTVAGDYHEGDLSQAMNKSALVANIVDTWITKGEGRPTLCFAVDRAHARNLQEQFEAAGVPCGYVDAYTDADDRKRIRDKFHNGEYKVVCNIGTLTTGVDWDVRCIILARPTKSEMLFVQIIGRGLRKATGKDDCLILDHSDNHLRLGFVTDISHAELDRGERKKAAERKAPLPKECPKCAFLKPPKTAKCPCCGFKPEARSAVDEMAGELEEMVRGTGSKSGGPKNHIRLQGQWIPYAAFFGQLKQYARERGYKPGWAANQYRNAIGTWPNHYASAPEQPVSYEVASWIRSQLIRYAKGKGASEPRQQEPSWLAQKILEAQVR
jgi:DNA repair protein RadD